jgi:Uncharacterized protein conserved in bacteria (DUF2188)
MTSIIYVIVEHDGGWAYKLGDVYSETFRNRADALRAAKRAAAEQRVPGDDVGIGPTPASSNRSGVRAAAAQ